MMAKRERNRIISFLITMTLLIGAMSVDVGAVETSTKDRELNVASQGLSEVQLEYGYHGISLNSKARAKKAGLAKMLSSFDDQKAGVDYVKDRVTFLADTEDRAREVASCYNGELVFYQYGVAAVSLDFEEAQAQVNSDLPSGERLPMNMKELLQLSAREDNNLPAVFPDRIVKLDTIPVDEAMLQTLPDPLITYNSKGGRLNTNDPYINAQYYHKYVNDYEVWEDDITGEGVTVAVIDTGVNPNHEDLIDNLLLDKQYNPIAADAEQTYYTDTKDATDDHGHGTHCAGIVAASIGNGVGGSGVAPGASIIPIKVLDVEGRGETSHTLAAINYAVEQGADIISMSLGDDRFEPECAEVVQNAIKENVVIVASAGNENTSLFQYPAAYDGVISVSALSKSEGSESECYYMNDDSLTEETLQKCIGILNAGDCTKPLRAAEYSNYGWSTIAAPGTDILSTYRGEKGGGEDYFVSSGTSMATPIVSGIIALMKEVDPELTPSEVEEYIKQSSDKVTYRRTGENDHVVLKCGMLNAKTAVDLVRGESDPETPVFCDYRTREDGSVIASSDEYLRIQGSGRIYYTDNGKDPKKNGKLYRGPIPLDFNGKKTFKAVSFANGKYTSAAVLTMTARVEATRIEAEKEKIIIQPGKSLKVKAVCSPLNAAMRLSYSVDNKTDFQISSTGVLKAGKKALPGQSTIITMTDYYTGEEATLQAVIAQAPGRIVVPEDLPSLLSTSEDLGHATVYDLKEEFGKVNEEFKEILEFSSSNPKVAAVENGVLIPKSAGKAKITATLQDGSNRKKTWTIAVVDPVRRLGVETDTLCYASEEYSDYGALGNRGCKVVLKAYDEREERIGLKYDRLSFVSSDPNILKVSKKGVVTPGKKAEIGDTASVEVRTVDGTEKSVRFDFTIVEPIKDFWLEVNAYEKSGEEVGQLIRSDKLRKWSAVIPGSDGYGHIVLHSSLPHNDDYEYEYHFRYTERDASDPDRTIFGPEFSESFADWGMEFLIDDENIIGFDWDEESDRIDDNPAYLELYHPGTTNVTYRVADGSGKKVVVKCTVLQK